ncbi:branched-chain amino acid transport system permease protein [Hydrogenoanaerobacterium saccharovorans]|uniref:Amino acid/amide ABC transporter membrane protein 1, HAAT family n=1 Tax=Hydrogenoanaerobacterium saccharovorans TaxID=474960 RepID=A0A1H8B812_9FIRM|nr:branched-chain amino acid ABC transporter permease [Hydrogenoanaerobacterium saccharovorans]RPF47561.1 branched-chain amino acid transport system permease protein [Hydrogenoanaerobacterium saccharovorans]SEM78519.1 amino acid/amide ABC transporter membrane protein 1, HAAT family [Hydrogenoanaerobacterium saccharovorans]
MEYFLNQLINGLCQGAIYALMAIGYSVVVGVVGMVTFTHGEVIMIGAFASFYVFEAVGNNLLLGVLASFLASWLIGMFVYKVCYERFFNAPRHISLICTIGASMLIKNLAQIIFGPNQKPMLNVVENQFFNIGTVQISMVQVIVIITVVVLAVLLSLFFNKTKWGIALRAVSQDKGAAYLMGINVKRTAMIGNCIGCGLGGVAGMLLAIYYQTLSATMGGSMGMKAFSSSVLGGLTDIRCSALGGLCIGIIENLGITVSSASFRDIFAFGFLILVLIIKPEGFASKKGVRP